MSTCTGMGITSMNSLPLFFFFCFLLFLADPCFKGVLLSMRIGTIKGGGGSEWGLECFGALVEAGEEPSEDGQRIEEAQNVFTEVSAYEN